MIVIEQIQGDDPSYDPVALACTSGVDRDRFVAALDRVYTDGYYGPVSAADWQEQDVGEPSTVSDACACSELAREIDTCDQLSSPVTAYLGPDRGLG